jgi:plastocyanin
MGSRACSFGVLSVMAFASPAVAADTIRVTIEKLKFAPTQVSAHIGDTIEWVSSDFVAHTATARNKDFDVAIPANGTGRVTPACRRGRLLLSLSSKHDWPDFGRPGIGPIPSAIAS